MHSLAFQDIRVDVIKNLYQPFSVGVDVLRLDRLHPHVSGNKWFKLKEHLKEAHAQKQKALLTFGGAYSNHIAATAAACQEADLGSIGIIRGEQPPILSHTLKLAKDMGMELYFIARSAYKTKPIPHEVWQRHNPAEVYIVGEGGYGIKGREGAECILQYCERERYTHILAAVGTGTTLAGIAAAALPQQEVIGISVLKNHLDLEKEVAALLPPSRPTRFTVQHQYHFGGYAKATPALFSFMNNWHEFTGIPSDFVYTGKLFFAADNLIKKGYFPQGSRILLIHSGGLQGNLSLPKGTLIY